MNKLCPFTQNQVDWFLRSLTSWFNMSEGGKRAGKNILAVQSFCAQLEDHPNKIHLVAGVSIATAKLNVIDCDGFGVANYFEGRCRPGVYNNRECLYIDTKVGEKILLISGGGKANDFKLIKGNTYGMAMITEVNECHKDFVMEVFDRTMTSKKRRIYHDLNPKPPKNWYYMDIEAFHKTKQIELNTYGFTYGHFTIADNLSITDEELKIIINTYDKNSLWYKRDILGQRLVSEGLIYPKFVNTQESYIIDSIPSDFGGGYITIGVDFGGNKSGHAFNATLISKTYKKIITVKDYWCDEDMDSEDLTEAFVKFVKAVRKEFRRYPITKCYADSAEQVLIRSLRAGLINAGINVIIVNARKGIINNRIRFYNKLFSLFAYKIMRTCEPTIEAFENALWAENNKQDDERLDDGSTNVDTLDAQEYSTEEQMPTILKLIDYGGR